MTHSLSLGLFIQIRLHNITLYKQMLYFEGSRHIFEEIKERHSNFEIYLRNTCINAYRSSI